jgi:hypothetical protein
VRSVLAHASCGLSPETASARTTTNEHTRLRMSHLLSPAPMSRLLARSPAAIAGPSQVACPTLASQPRRLMIAPAAAGCKRLLGCRSTNMLRCSA